MSLVTDIQSDLLLSVRETLEALIAEFQDELRQQGHVLTGKLLNSMEVRIASGTNQVVGSILIEDYGSYLETGVSASRIPFSGRTGRGGTSKYIQGLIRFFQLKGLSGAEAKGAAFATANKHKREGMPTRASYRFSKNGRRAGFINQRLQESEPKILAKFEEVAGNRIEFRILEVFTDRFKNVA